MVISSSVSSRILRVAAFGLTPSDSLLEPGPHLGQEDFRDNPGFAQPPRIRDQ